MKQHCRCELASSPARRLGVLRAVVAWSSAVAAHVPAAFRVPAVLLVPIALLAPAAHAAPAANQAHATEQVRSAKETHIAPVGSVSLVLGRAHLLSADGRREPISVGTTVRATDRIITDTNGHVHIRFVDDALVSVRPNSRLDIVQYDYVAERPQDSVIRLSLDEGITRSISGAGATAARERFRLNTPIAAIGVRGTDFVVSATRRAVRAQVNEGVIIMAPYSNDCMLEGVGPCLADAVELTGNSLQVLAMEDSDASPQLLADSMLYDADAVSNDESETPNVIASNSDDKATASEKYLENVTPQRLEEVARVVRPPAPNFTPSAPVAAGVLDDRQLLWGRWGEGYGADERITLPYAVARVDRDTTMGKNGYILFRDGGGRERVDAGLGAISFALNSAQAFYHSDTGVVAMAISGGALDVNFDTQQFSTSLNMSHRLTGQVDFRAEGAINDSGFFTSRSDQHEVRGTVGLDGSEAGYFFEKQLEAGGIQGLTLWDKH